MGQQIQTITSAAGTDAEIPSVSQDGNSIVYQLSSGGNENIYLYNRPTLTTTLLSKYMGAADNHSQLPSYASAGNIVSFYSPSAFGYVLPAGATSEVYTVNVAAISPTIASITQAGQIADNNSDDSVVSPGGTTVGFSSTADNLGLGSPDTAAAHDYTEAYVKNTTTGALTLVSRTQAGVVAGLNSAGMPSESLVTAISADDNTVALLSDAINLAPGLGINNSLEVYTKNLQTGALTLVSQDSQSDIANGTNIYGSISNDGNLVAFVSTATNLKPDNSTSPVANAEAYVKNVATGTLDLVSSTSAGVAGAGGDSINVVLSADGKFAAFQSDATNLPGANGHYQIYVKNLASGATTLISKDATGAAGTSDSTLSYSLDGQSFSADDTQLVFSTTAPNLDGGASGQQVVEATGLDTATQQVSINQDVHFTSATAAKLTGTVSDVGDLTSVQVFDGSNDLGTASVAANGTWTLAATLTAGDHTLSAAASYAAGNVVTAAAPFFLQTGIKGAYASYEEDFDAGGNLTGEVFTKKNGKVYKSDVVTNLSNGDHLIDTNAGTYFQNQPFSEQTDLYNPSYSKLLLDTLDNNDGSHTLTGSANKLTIHSIADDTITGGGKSETFVFSKAPGQETITDFMSKGNGHDIVSLSKSDFSSIADVLSSTHQHGSDAVIELGHHSSIVLQNVTVAELKADKQDLKLHA